MCYIEACKLKLTAGELAHQDKLISVVVLGDVLYHTSQSLLSVKRNIKLNVIQFHK